MSSNCNDSSGGDIKNDDDDDCDLDGDLIECDGAVDGVGGDDGDGVGSDDGNGVGGDDGDCIGGDDGDGVGGNDGDGDGDGNIGDTGSLSF